MAAAAKFQRPSPTAAIPANKLAMTNTFDCALFKLPIANGMASTRIHARSAALSFAGQTARSHHASAATKHAISVTRHSAEPSKSGAILKGTSNA